jgi:hypothetical protein
MSQSSPNPTLELHVSNGDIILFARSCLAMDLISSVICISAKVTSLTEWDHLGLVVENPETKELHLLEANAGGVTLHPLKDRLKRTKSLKIAVRKLMSPLKYSDDFRNNLWSTAMTYKSKKYNNNFLEMIGASVTSYANYFSTLTEYNEKLFCLQKNYHFLQEEIIQNDQSNLSTSLLHQVLQHSKQSLFQEIKTVHEKVQSLHPPEPAANTADSDESNRYFCSQLVAELLMEMNLITSHRQPNQYVPVDFSSSGFQRALLPPYHSPNHLTTSLLPNNHEADSLFTSDFIVPTLKETKMTLKLGKTPENPGALSKLQLEFPVFAPPATPSTTSTYTPPTLPPVINKLTPKLQENVDELGKKAEELGKKAEEIGKKVLEKLPPTIRQHIQQPITYTIPLHVGDIIPYELLTQLIHLQQQESLWEMKINGEVRILTRSNTSLQRSKPVPTATTTPSTAYEKYCTVGILKAHSDKESQLIPTIQYLEEIHDLLTPYRKEFYLQAFEPSTITLTYKPSQSFTPPDNENGEITNKKKKEEVSLSNYLVISRRNELIQIVWQELVNSLSLQRYEHNFFVSKSIPIEDILRFMVC